MGEMLSPEAEVAIREANERHARNDHINAIMNRGPYIDGDEVIIPSIRYSPDARIVYPEKGFVWDGESKAWVRNVTWPVRDKVYSAKAWLSLARRLYRQVWPQWIPSGFWTVYNWTDEDWQRFLRGSDKDAVDGAYFERQKREREERVAACVCHGLHWIAEAGRWVPCPECNDGGRLWFMRPEEEPK